MTKRKNELSNKLSGTSEARPGWRDTIRVTPQVAEETERETETETRRPQQRPQQRRNKPKRKTYLLTPDLIERVEDTAAAERVGINELVRFLLSTALEMVETGELEIPTTPGRRRIAR